MSCEFSYFPFFGRAGVCTIGGHGEYHILRNACMTFHGRPQGATTGSVRPYCWSQDIGILLQNVTPRNAGQQRCTSLKQQTPNLRALYMHLTSTPHTHHPTPCTNKAPCSMAPTGRSNYPAQNHWNRGAGAIPRRPKSSPNTTAVVWMQTYIDGHRRALQDPGLSQ